jgi:heme-degrading monooxygenase HmoA
MVIRFQTEEAAADWRNSEQHKALSPRLKALHQGSELVVYAVVHEA